MSALKALLQPSSVAVVGDCEKPGERGYELLANLRAGGFAGLIFPLDPGAGGAWELPSPPDLVIMCTPAGQVPEQMMRLGERGARAAVVMAQDPDGEHAATPLKQAISEVTSRYGMRWLGPRSAGVQSPRAKLNASRMSRMPPVGKLALVSQSASLGQSIVSWAVDRGIGFASVTTLGEAGNVDVADMLDHLAADGSTQGVLLCLRRIDDGRKFMAAARAFARLKPVVVLWAQGAQPAAQSHDPSVDQNEACRRSSATASRATSTQSWASCSRKTRGCAGSPPVWDSLPLAATRTTTW